MTKEKKLLSFYQKQKTIQELKKILPEVFEDGKLDLLKLKSFLGVETVLDEANYGLSWPGKDISKFKRENKKVGRLILNKEKSSHPNKSNNQLIEGDNLDVLQILQEDYLARIKLIYIDPPYNTGKSFVYNDRFKLRSKQYLKYLDKIEIGRVNSSLQNQLESGEIHTNWLNMIYPRLSLSKNLLTDDGCVVISIDESEKANVQLLCNEIFGEENFVACFVWINRTTTNDSTNLYTNNHEYILVYAKEAKKIKFLGEEKDLSAYKNADNDPNGLWMPDNPTAASGNQNSQFPIINPYTGEQYFPPVGRYWAFSEKRVREWENSGKIVFPKEKGKRFLLKKYMSELKNTNKPVSSIISDIPTLKGTRELKELYPEGLPFKYPKPTELLVKLFAQLTGDDDIVLDAFAGSASSAHAIFKLNARERSNRTFICIQNDEEISKGSDAYNMNFHKICDISRDRIVRAGKLYSYGDIGFNYFKTSFLE